MVLVKDYGKTQVNGLARQKDCGNSKNDMAYGMSVITTLFEFEHNNVVHNESKINQAALLQ